MLDATGKLITQPQTRHCEDALRYLEDAAFAQETGRVCGAKDYWWSDMASAYLREAVDTCLEPQSSDARLFIHRFNSEADRSRLLATRPAEVLHHAAKRYAREGETTLALDVLSVIFFRRDVPLANSEWNPMARHAGSPGFNHRYVRRRIRKSRQTYCPDPCKDRRPSTPG